MATHNSFWLDAVASMLRRWPLWLTSCVVGLFLLLPFVIAYLDGALPVVLADGTWRLLLMPSVMILYALLTVPLLSTLDAQIVAGIRPLSQVAPHDFDQLVAAARRPYPRRAGLAFVVGMVIQLALFGLQRSYTPLEFYLFIAFLIMFGTLGWLVYKAVAETRLGRVLVRQPLTVDIFDLTPFEPIGRQSLLLAMVFVGGATLSLFFVFTRENILQWRNVVIYATLILITLVVFFLNMWPTHRLLAQTRACHVQRAAAAIAAAYNDLTRLTARNEYTASVESTINAWAVMEARLKVTRTWPYNTELLRALVVTVLMPVAFGVTRLVGAYLAMARP